MNTPILLISLLWAQQAAAQQFLGLGSFGLGISSGTPTAISDDGTTVIGTEVTAPAQGNPPIQNSFYWRADWLQLPSPITTIQLLDKPMGAVNPTMAKSVSADGSSIIADAYWFGSGFRSYLWNIDDAGNITTSLLPFNGNLGGAAQAISGDGKKVVGLATFAGYFSQVFIWDRATGQLTPVPNNTAYSVHPKAVSHDGAAFVGTGYGFTDSEATYWDSTGGVYLSMHSLMPGNINPQSEAQDITPDGTMAVGYSNAVYGSQKAFAWSAQKGIFPIRSVSGTLWATEALGLSANGDVVVGRIYNRANPSQSHAIRWVCDHSRGTYTASFLYLDLVNAGVGSVANWKLLSATAVSADGTKIVGPGANPGWGWLIVEPWYADLPVNAPPGNLSCM